jgi:hypothetical protein
MRNATATDRGHLGDGSSPLGASLATLFIGVAGVACGIIGILLWTGEPGLLLFASVAAGPIGAVIGLVALIRSNEERTRSLSWAGLALNMSLITIWTLFVVSAASGNL